MELTTFGAVLGFALEHERAAAQVYAEASRDPIHAAATSAFTEAAAEKRAHVVWLERSRREHVAEMLLEPISGLRGEDFLLPLSMDPQAGQLLDRLIRREKAAQEFYQTAARHIGLPEGAGLLQRIGERTAGRRLLLEQMRSELGSVLRTPEAPTPRGRTAP